MKFGSALPGSVFRPARLEQMKKEEKEKREKERKKEREYYEKGSLISVVPLGNES